MTSHDHAHALLAEPYDPEFDALTPADLAAIDALVPQIEVGRALSTVID